MHNLVYISQGTFWKNAKMKTFEHHDILFKDLANKIELTVHIGLPMFGDTYLKRLLDGNDKMVMKTWKEIPYRIYDGFYTGEIDSIFINGCEYFNEVKTPSGKIITNDDMYDYIYDICDKCYNDNKPIVLYDPDDFINLNLRVNSGSKSISRLVYDKYKHYNNFYLIGPCMNGVRNDCINEYMFVPFGLDKNNKCEIKPFSERHYVTRYVGNNYFRENFIPYFRECSNYGKTTVNGHHWTQVARDNSDCENLVFGRGFPLTIDKVENFFNDAKIGLYGTVDKFKSNGHFTLRIREYYQAGIFIIPENIDYMINSICIDNYKITCNNISDFNFNMTDEEYNYIVNKQRDKLADIFDISKYTDLLINRIYK